MQDLAQQTVVVEKDYYLHSRFVYQRPKIQLLVVDTTLARKAKWLKLCGNV